MNSISLFFQQYLSIKVFHVTVIVAVAWLLIGLSRKMIRVFRGYMHSRSDSVEENKRIETLARVFRHIATVVITLVSSMLILSEMGISIAPILGAAGVAGIAVGFGAQSLIKDYFNGFFILLENQIRQGDVVEMCDKGGLVEDITLRHVRLRDYEGSVHYIPNGLITTVTNMSRGYAYAVIDVGIAYRENIDEAFKIMREAARHLRADRDFGDRILEDIEIAGVDKWADSAVILRCRFKTASLEQWAVRREYLRRLKAAFDEHGIEIPYPHMTIHSGQDKQGNSALHLALQGKDG